MVTITQIHPPPIFIYANAINLKATNILNEHCTFLHRTQTDSRFQLKKYIYIYQVYLGTVQNLMS